MTYVIKSPRRLIEVALPLDAINVASAREKSIRHGHPSTMHLWWARRPLATARAVIFGQMVNDPSWKWEMDHPGEIPPSNLKASWAASRKRIFAILEKLVEWESTTDEEILLKARAEIRKSWREVCELNKAHPQAATLFDPERLPAFHDPFAGGGAIPLEAQRLGFEAYASDLNPVAVLINKCLIEIPPKFAGLPACNPEAQGHDTLIERQWRSSDGLIEDVRYYGKWVWEQALKRLGHFYPKVEITAQMAKQRPELKALVGQKLTVIAWMWARTVQSPSPAFKNIAVPLVSNFMLSTRAGKEAYVEPVVEEDGYHFVVKVGKPRDIRAASNGTKLARANFRCVMSGTPISGDYIKAEGKAGRMGARLMAIIADSDLGRVYLDPILEMEQVAVTAQPSWKPQGDVPSRLTGGTCVPYGLEKWSDLFTPRQLTALTVFTDLVHEAIERAEQDVRRVREGDDSGLAFGGTGAKAYAEAIGVYLALAVDRMANTLCTIARWTPDRQQTVTAFARQAIPMTWDFPEVNPFAGAAGDYLVSVEGVTKGIPTVVGPSGKALQEDATTQQTSVDKIVSTDPPYYDNIAYADLSDFFYVWLRRAMKPIFPELFATLAVPKEEELVAAAYRHGGKDNAEQFFLNGMTRAMRRLVEQSHPAVPVTIYYAFKQSESESEDGITSTGWETFLEAVHRAGFALTGTWPMRTELGNRMIGSGTNALASSVVMVCRSRPADAPSTSRRAFQRELNKALPQALDEMTRGSGDDRSPVAPVDLSQAIIGPGMAIFSKYSAVLEANGLPMKVSTALQLINRFLAEDDFDHDTQFCLHWFEQYGWKEGKFGDADTLARAKGTSVDGVKHTGVLFATAGVVRLLKWSDYAADWEAAADRLPVWAALHHLIRVFKTEGELGAGVLLAAVRGKAEATRQLAYRLYTLCERAGWAEDARAYNEIITGWSAIEAAAAHVPGMKQADLFEA